MSEGGALMFARFAYPPNDLGYCGPDASAELLERVHAGAGGPRLRALAQAFGGAWPYLELIAGANAIADPLDAQVVEAYWVGNGLLDRVRPRVLADSLVTRFGSQVRDRDRLLAPLGGGAVPHHGFHVFGVYPWVGLLRAGRVDEPLAVLDRCRIRWGFVESVADDEAIVTSRPLRWTGARLELGVPRQERVIVGRRGYHLTSGLNAGDWCALHWDWACQRLTARQLRALRGYTRRQLAAVNGVPYPAPATVLV
jgi:uncharacterized protein DUF6390